MEYQLTRDQPRVFLKDVLTRYSLCLTGELELSVRLQSCLSLVQRFLQNLRTTEEHDFAYHFIDDARPAGV